MLTFSYVFVVKKQFLAKNTDSSSNSANTLTLSACDNVGTCSTINNENVMNKVTNGISTTDSTKVSKKRDVSSMGSSDSDTSTSTNSNTKEAVDNEYEKKCKKN